MHVMFPGRGTCSLIDTEYLVAAVNQRLLGVMNCDDQLTAATVLQTNSISII